ncbi:MAG: PrsW family intramembrane metalloprotease [Candidatus Pacebacteria bacterium]|nr:PrsW family intramembrane metalloprotease [Candidatus Paceibacterota bacterium]
MFNILITNHLILYPLLGGLLPTIIWLWFWLKEDKLNPEPKKYIFYSFIIGMITALLVLPLEGLIIKYFPYTGLLTIILLSSSEELFKYFGAYFSALRKKYMDEPIDAVVYLITVALGFAALENSLFVISTIKSIDFNLTKTILVSDMRFMGATLLHILSSGVIGLFIALSFYKSKILKISYLFFGLILSIILHSTFNFFIIKEGDDGIFIIFMITWIAIIILILSLEKVKRLGRNNLKLN